jgi:hypothetical protein
MRTSIELVLENPSAGGKKKSKGKVCGKLLVEFVLLESLQ